MRAHSGSTSEGFLPTSMSATGANATAVAPAPEDPSAKFADYLQQQEETPQPITPSEPQTDPIESEATLTDASSADTANSTGSSSASNWLSFSNQSATTVTATVASPMTKTSFLSSLLAGLPKNANAPTANSSSTSTSMPKSAATTTSALPFQFATTGFGRFGSSNKSGANAAGADSANTSDDSLPTYAWIDVPKTPAPATAPGTALASASDLAKDASTTADSDAARATMMQTARKIALPLPVPPKTGMLTAPTTTKTATTSSDDTSATTTSRNMLTGSPLSAMVVHAAVLAASNKNDDSTTQTADSASSAVETTDEAASDSTLAAGPFFAGIGKPTTATPTEKKSVAPHAERSFIQADTEHSYSSDTSSNGLASAIAAASQVANNQPVTTTSTSSEKTSGSVSGASLASTGTMNGKKDTDMNSTLDTTSMVVSTGTNALVNRTPANVHILLGSNNDFPSAIEQVMHVAELSSLSRSTPPLRVAIEIQTPPGAIVNVYVSRQADSSYRAQLSTSDVQALAWVQDQVSTLKTTTDNGVDIRWAPAQIESNTATTLSSGSTGNDRSFNWEQNHQNGYQQPDERRQPTSQTDDEDETEFAVPFFQTLGRVA